MDGIWIFAAVYAAGSLIGWKRVFAVVVWTVQKLWAGVVWLSGG